MWFPLPESPRRDCPATVGETVLRQSGDEGKVLVRRRSERRMVRVEGG
jgi:hypothetical protein